jgi:hypothetical protein
MALLRRIPGRAGAESRSATAVGLFSVPAEPARHSNRTDHARPRGRDNRLPGSFSGTQKEPGNGLAASANGRRCDWHTRYQNGCDIAPGLDAILINLNTFTP